MKNLILLIIILTLVSAGYLVFHKDSPLSEFFEPILTGSTKIPASRAVENVKKLPEVQQYLKEVPKALVEVDNEDEGEYNVHVYEVKNGHTATFNWYRVSIKSGEVQKQLPVTKGWVLGKLCYPSEVVPEGIIEAKRIEDGKVFILNHGGSEDERGTSYKFKLEKGNYYLRYKTKTNFIGYSTAVCPTGKEESCGDTKQRIERKAEVKPGETVTGYDLCDYYYKDSNAPKF